MILEKKEPIKRNEQNGRRKRRKGVKIFCLCIYIALLILTFLLIPLNLFVVNFPEWVVALCTGASLVMLITYLIVFRTGLITKILLPVFSAMILICSLFAAYCCPYWNSYSFKQVNMVWMNFDEELTVEQAKEDLAAAMRHLRRVHPMFRSGLTADIQERYDASLARLDDMQTITVNDLRREIQLVINPLHDAHTTTHNNWPEDRYLADIPMKRHEGYAMDSVNGRTWAEVVEAAAPYYSYETKDWITVDTGSLATLLFLEYEEPFTFVWRNEAGETVTERYTADDFVPWETFESLMASYAQDDETALGVQDNEAAPGGETEEAPFVFYEIDEERSLALLTLTACNYNDEYIRCVREMFEEVKEKQIRNVAVDVRGNGGGDSRVANELIRYLPVRAYRDMPCDWRWGWFVFSNDGEIKNKQYENLLFDGGVYILTDSGSFSSAMDFAMIIQDNGLGQVVGEPPANAVNSYGDVALFSLPNSGLLMQISTKKWYRIDETNPDDYVMPDIPCAGADAVTALYEVLP
ncbi:MAG: S41 family peptidase [Clostridium sp.]|nr:S41 family peptidase [Clostridium sp.]